MEYIFAYLSLKTKYDYNRRIAKGSMKPAPKRDFCDLAVVTFNNSKVVEYQIRTLAKFFRYPYRYTVFDNSNNEEKAKEIEAICERYDTGYIRLPQQEFIPKGMGSYSHGIACNYLYNRFIKNRGVNISDF